MQQVRFFKKFKIFGRQKSLSVLLFIWLFGLTFLFSLLFGGVGYFFAKEISEFRYLGKVEDTKRIAQAVLSEPLWKFDYPTAAVLLKVFSSPTDPTLCSIQLSGPKGEFIGSHSQVSECPEPVQAVSERIYHGEEVLGRVDYKFSKAFYQSSFQQMILWILSGLFFIVICAAFLFQSILLKYVRAPFQALLGFIQSSRTHREMRFHEGSSQEFIEISEAFNLAQSEIQKRDLDLIKYSKNLEELVEQRTKERDQDRKKAAMAQYWAAIGQISAGVSHEINNPLMVISGKLISLNRKLQKVSDVDWQKDFQRIEDMVHRIAKIVKGLSVYVNQPETSSTETKASLSEVVNSAVSSFLNESTQSSHPVTVSVCPELEQRSDFNPHVLKRVVQDLVKNAREATSHMQNSKIQVEVQSHAEGFSVSVRDEGPGVPENCRDRLFSPFFTTKEVGSGVGLALSMARAELAQENAQIDYSRDSGSTVFMIKYIREARESRKAS